MFEYSGNIKQTIKNSFMGVNIKELINHQIELEVFRTDYLNAPQSIKTDLFELQLYKKFCIKNDFFLIYSLKSENRNLQK